MKYEYNGNLIEDDRINLVANEVISCYPLIPLEKAKEVAMLEDRISSEKTLDMIFNRLYNIMLVMSYDKKIIKEVYTDLARILNNNKTNEKYFYYYDIVLEIYNFFIGTRDFPLLDEFM